jgi:hypothetical protein
MTGQIGPETTFGDAEEREMGAQAGQVPQAIAAETLDELREGWVARLAEIDAAQRPEAAEEAKEVDGGRAILADTIEAAERLARGQLGQWFQGRWAQDVLTQTAWAQGRERRAYCRGAQREAMTIHHELDLLARACMSNARG